MKLFIKYWIYYLRKLNWWSADDFGKIRAIVFWCEIIFGIPGLTRVGLTAGYFHTLPQEPGMSTLNRPRYRKLRPTALSPSIISIIHTNTRPQDVSLSHSLHLWENHLWCCLRFFAWSSYMIIWQEYLITVQVLCICLTNQLTYIIFLTSLILSP